MDAAGSDRICHARVRQGRSDSAGYSFHEFFRNITAKLILKTAYIHGAHNFAVKISTGFFNNHTYGLPSLSGMMIVFDAETGRAEAILADNGYLTAVRTALSGLIAAKYLARADSTRVAVIGSGEQARLQVRALKLLFPLEQVNVWSRNDDHAVEYAQEMQDVAPQVRAYERIEDACRDADIIVTTTPAIEPVLLAEHVSRGSHITAIGSDNEFKREISGELLTMVDIFCCDLQSQSESHGELKYFQKQTSGNALAGIRNWQNHCRGNRLPEKTNGYIIVLLIRHWRIR
ncbi:ectoine utilization protein EutC [Klebsiella quasipneumoniae]|nr:ectoine utilization protein EutC [Klebsiella quasipneumoniae]